MTRRVLVRDLEGHKPGDQILLSDEEAAAAIAQGRVLGIQRCLFKEPFRKNNPGEKAWLFDGEAEGAAKLGLVEILPPEPGPEELVLPGPPEPGPRLRKIPWLPDVEAPPAPESKGLERPPADRSIHRAPVTKELKP